jgi:hypothetical protein
VFEATGATNGTDSITGFTVGAAGDVLNFSAANIDGNGTSTAPTLAGVLTANPGATDVSGTVVRLVNIVDGQDVMTADGLQTALRAGGEYANLNLADSGSFIVLAANNQDAGTTNAYLVTDGDATGGVLESVALIGTLSNVDIDNFTAANFLV